MNATVVEPMAHTEAVEPAAHVKERRDRSPNVTADPQHGRFGHNPKTWFKESFRIRYRRGWSVRLSGVRSTRIVAARHSSSRVLGQKSKRKQKSKQERFFHGNVPCLEPAEAHNFFACILGRLSSRVREGSNNGGIRMAVMAGHGNVIGVRCDGADDHLIFSIYSLANI